MANLQEMGRVLCSHRWDDVREWAQAVDQLASLTEQEIAELVLLTAVPGDASAAQLLIP